MAKEVEPQRVTKTSKQNKATLPKGAKILTKSTRVDIEEIENGFLITKCFDIKYEYPTGGDDGMRTDYMYYNKKWFSTTDPLQIKLDGDKGLADAFNED